MLILQYEWLILCLLLVPGFYGLIHITRLYCSMEARGEVESTTDFINKEFGKFVLWLICFKIVQRSIFVLVFRNIDSLAENYSWELNGLALAVTAGICNIISYFPNKEIKKLKTARTKATENQPGQ